MQASLPVGEGFREVLGLEMAWLLEAYRYWFTGGNNLGIDIPNSRHLGVRHMPSVP